MATETKQTTPIPESKMEPECLSLDDTPVIESRLKIVSKDSVEFEITKKNAWLSCLVRTAADGDKESTEIPAPGVDSATMKLVVEYLDHHNGVAGVAPDKPLRSNVMKQVCKDEWDANFIDKVAADRDQLYDLIQAANYMDIKCLMSLACARVAANIKGVPLDKIPEKLKSKKTEIAREARRIKDEQDRKEKAAKGEHGESKQEKS